MEVPRHVLQTYIRTNEFPLIQHHKDSFNAMLNTDIPTFIRAMNPLTLELGDKTTNDSTRRYIRVWIGGKEKTAIRYSSPVELDGTAVVPQTCRLNNMTYALSVHANIDIEYEVGKEKITKSFPDVSIGQIPLMLRSQYCHLTSIPSESVDECKFEIGGYFIVEGVERALLTQELLGNNMFYAGVRKRKKSAATGSKTLVEKEAAVEIDLDVREKMEYEDEDEYYAAIKTMSEDGTRGAYSHFLTLPSEASIVLRFQEDGIYSPLEDITKDYARLVMIQLSGFQNPVPVISLFRALGLSSDRDIYESVLAGVPDRDRSKYDDIFYQIIVSHETFLRRSDQTDLKVLALQTRSGSNSEVVKNLYEKLFSHVEGDMGDAGSLFRRKGYMLGTLLKMAMDVAIGRRGPSDRDSMQFKRFKTSGVLCFEEFRRNYIEISNAMLLKMDKRVQYEPKNYAGTNIADLVQTENINRYWSSWMLLSGFTKSFKGAWGKEIGVSQILPRASYMSAIHFLRGSSLQIDKTISTAPPRRLYASLFGLLCPVDSPDGSDIGYKKGFAMFAQVSTAFSVAKVKEVMKNTNLFLDTANIHPSTWKPEWTKIYLNSDLVGVCIGDTEVFHTKMLAARRSNELAYSVSLSWMRVNNEYKIYCDAGRPIRPVYREGTTSEQIVACKTWADMMKYVDYIDAYETDSLLISLTPFHPEQPSEMHMTFNLSAITNLVPFSDHNPVTRSVFAIQQQKYAAAWFHTNYMKRFDTIAMMLCQPQKPLSQTWVYNEIMGRGGCLPYGINAIVAVTVYGGSNQEDAVILNKSAVQRGMYQTMYYHSYEVCEEFIYEAYTYIDNERVVDQNSSVYTEIVNPKNKNIKLKSGKDYDKLDSNGIIRLGSIVDEKTILIGHISPIFSAKGHLEGHRDNSIEAKRGQLGRVDAIYSFHNDSGRKCVKIRVVEERFPIVGDKMASRHSQKGVVGELISEQDMPFTKEGIRPDLIFNPHGLPSRMTTGQVIEIASNKLGGHLGCFTDATPFTTTNRLQDLRKALVDRGFHPHGHEVLYNGRTGEQMEADIFMGPIYYQRLKHMVEDKINYREQGPMKLLTRQPTQGRGDEGGMRIGEMERDALISHGMSKFLQESLMDRSDKQTIVFDHEEGRFDTSKDMIDVPHSMALFSQELEALHVQLHIQTDSV